MTAPASEIWRKRSLFLITGASRGLGRAISTALTEKVRGSKALFILIARDETKLGEVKSIISNATTDVHVAPRNLSKPSTADFKEIINTALASHNYKPEDFDQLWLIHNAGSLGDITKGACDFKDFAEVQSYFDFNLTSVILLTSAFLEIFKQSKGHIRVVHITSLAAISPLKGLSLYCTGKAARDMYFKVLAVENPKIRILSYSPGPLQTDMADELIKHGPPEIKQHFEEMRKEDKILKCETTVENLLRILEKDEYESGDHVDVFDRC